jgi:hypothetical protein
MWERSKTIKEIGLELGLVPGIARLQGQSMLPEAAALGDGLGLVAEEYCQ